MDALINKVAKNEDEILKDIYIDELLKNLIILHTEYQEELNSSAYERIQDGLSRFNSES